MDTDRRFQPGRFLIDRAWWLLPAVLAAALALPWTFGERWYSDGPYYQAIATQMAREGTWWSPMQGDLPYFNKPPLAFWIHGVLVRMFGNADWAAHLPEAAAFIAVCVLTAGIIRRTHGNAVGVVAGCVMALTNDWIWRVGNFKLDGLHTMWLLGALACWGRAFVPEADAKSDRADARVRGDIGWSVIAGVCVGAALMTKPLYGLGVGALALAWLGLGNLLTVRRAALVGLSLLVGILVAAPWHFSMISTHGHHFLQAYLHEQTVQRALGEMHDRQPWYWYVQLIGGSVAEAVQPERMWPIYGGAVIGCAAVGLRWRRAGRERSGDVLAVLWTIAWFVALSAFGGKRNYYVMVVHPGAAWLCAIVVVAALEKCAGEVRSGSDTLAVRTLRGAAVVGVVATIVLAAMAPGRISRERKTLPVPERDEFMAFIGPQHAAGKAVYDCGITYRIAALAYIQAGFWPRWPSERTGFTPDGVPSGALMVYRDDMIARKAYGTYIDPLDRLVFRSSPGGQYLVYERH